MSTEWPSTLEGRYKHTQRVVADWPTHGVRVALVLEAADKYPLAWARAQALPNGARVIVLCAVTEEEVTVTKKGLSVRARFSTAAGATTYDIQAHWGVVVDVHARTSTEYRLDRAATAKNKATLPAVKLLQCVSGSTDLLSPEELEEMK